MGPPLNITTFYQHDQCWADCPAPVRLEAFYTLSRTERDACWRDLAAACRQEVEDDYAYERALGEESPKRHQSAQRSTASSAIKPGAVALSDNDPLKQVPPRVYVEALTGEIVPANGMIRCPTTTTAPRASRC